MASNTSEYDLYATQSWKAAEVCQQQQIQDATAHLTNPDEIASIRNDLTVGQMQEWRTS